MVSPTLRLERHFCVDGLSVRPKVGDDAEPHLNRLDPRKFICFLFDLGAGFDVVRLCWIPLRGQRNRRDIDGFQATRQVELESQPAPEDDGSCDVNAAVLERCGCRCRGIIVSLDGALERSFEGPGALSEAVVAEPASSRYLDVHVLALVCCTSQPVGSATVRCIIQYRPSMRPPTFEMSLP